MFEKGKNPKNEHAEGIELQNLRTYEDDLKTVILSDDISTSKMVLAEQEKKRNLGFQGTQININDSFDESGPRKGMSKLGKRSLIIVISIVMILSGAYAIFYNFNHIKPYFKNLAFRNDNKSPEVLVANKKIIIESLGKTKGEIIGLMHKAAEGLPGSGTGEILEVIIQKNILIEEVEKIVQIDSVDFFKLIDARAPESLIRSLRTETSIGFHILDKPEPFIILKSENINQSYSGLLDWEQNMGTDLQKIFILSLSVPAPSINVPIVSENNSELMGAGELSATSTATTVAEPPVEKIKQEVLPTFDIGNFVDVIISNKDTRAIVNSVGKVIFFYTIVDNENIVFTTNKATLDLVLNRINQVNLVR